MLCDRVYASTKVRYLGGVNAARSSEELEQIAQKILSARGLNQREKDILIDCLNKAAERIAKKQKEKEAIH
jgi:truncated hemoglobin YjbI